MKQKHKWLKRLWYLLKGDSVRYCQTYLTDGCFHKNGTLCDEYLTRGCLKDPDSVCDFKKDK